MMNYVEIQALFHKDNFKWLILRGLEHPHQYFMVKFIYFSKTSQFSYPFNTKYTTEQILRCKQQ